MNGANCGDSSGGGQTRDVHLRQFERHPWTGGGPSRVLFAYRPPWGLARGTDQSGWRNERAHRLPAALARIDEPWSPRTGAVLNDDDIQVVKTKGESTRHRHLETDEVFLVLSGSLFTKIGRCVRGIA